MTTERYFLPVFSPYVLKQEALKLQLDLALTDWRKDATVRYAHTENRRKLVKRGRYDSRGLVLEWDAKILEKEKVWGPLRLHISDLRRQLAEHKHWSQLTTYYHDLRIFSLSENLKGCCLSATKQTKDTRSTLENFYWTKAGGVVEDYRALLQRSVISAHYFRLNLAMVLLIGIKVWSETCK